MREEENKICKKTDEDGKLEKMKKKKRVTKMEN